MGTNLAVSDDDDECTVSSRLRCGGGGSKFRTQDGSCNNLDHGNWGRANIALQRLLSPAYEDGLSIPRGANSDLPSARALSEALIPDVNEPSGEYTLALMQWGQFVDHDLTHTPLVKGEIETSFSNIKLTFL